MKNKYILSGDSSPKLAPCPAGIRHYFGNRLRYVKVPMEKRIDNPFFIKYSKCLNNADSPKIPELKGLTVISYIIVDINKGTIIDHYIKVNRGNAIHGYKECQNENIEKIFAWHSNLVHVSDEYLKGGWMFDQKIKKELSKRSFKYITPEKGVHGLLTNTIPESLKATTDETEK